MADKKSREELDMIAGIDGEPCELGEVNPNFAEESRTARQRYIEGKSADSLSVKIDVDISDALTGLKALQREARKATHALRELEETQPTGIFTKNEIVKWYDGDSIEYRHVICVDKDTAVLASVEYTGGSWYTSYDRLFAVANDKSIADKFERLNTED